MLKLNFTALVFTLFFVPIAYSQNQFQTFNTLNSPIPGDVVWRVRVDANQGVWTGSFVSGAAHYSQQSWTVYTLNNPLPGANVWSMDASPDGSHALGFWDSMGGFSTFKDGSWAHYTTTNSDLPNNFIAFILADSTDYWIGTRDSGLVHFDGNQFTTFNTSNTPMNHNWVRTIAKDQQDVLWFGATYDLVRYDGNNFTVYNQGNSGMNNYVVESVAIDTDGSVWVGTGIGLVHFDGSNWFTYNTFNSGLPNNHVKAVTIDDAGTKWIGTYGGGLAAFDGSNWTVWDMSNSDLPNNSINSIDIDSNQNKWIGTGSYFDYTGSGLVVFNENGLNFPPPVGFDERVEEENGLSVFPNPVLDRATIRTEEALPQGTRLEVYDLQGRLIKELSPISSANHSHSWEIRPQEFGMKKGIYLLKVQGHGKILTHKLAVS